MSTAYLYPVSPDEPSLGVISPVGSAYMYDCVNDTVGSPDEDSTNLGSAVVTEKTVIFNLSNWSAGQAVINSVRVTVRFKCLAAGATCNVTPKLRISSTNYDGGTSEDVDNSEYVDFSYIFYENPATGEAWAYTDLDSLMAGTGKAGKIRITQLYVTVDYTTPTIDVTKGTITVTGIATGLSSSRNMAVTAQSYNVNLIDAVLIKKLTMPVSSQTYDVTGIDVGLTAQIIMEVAVADISCTLIDAELTYTPGSTAYSIDVEVAEFLITGIDPVLICGRILNVDSQSVSVKINDANFIYVPSVSGVIGRAGFGALRHNSFWFEKSKDEIQNERINKIIKDDEEILIMLMAFVQNRQVV